MKRMLVITLLIILVAASQAWADAPQFSASVMATGATTDPAPGKFLLQGWSWATDGNDGIPLDSPISHAPITSFYAAAYKINGHEGWNGANGFYGGDDRGAIATGQTITEDIYVWASTGTSPERIKVAQGLSGVAGINYTLDLVSIPTGIIYNGLTHWTTPGAIILPFYSTDNGLTGYHFQATFTAVPEPSSILALVGGIVGFGGIALRRRR